jgi:hypothetical protein
MLSNITYYYIQVHVVPHAVVTYLQNGTLEKTVCLHQILRYTVEKCYTNFQTLKVAFGEQIMGWTQVFEWFSILKSNVTSAEGLPNAWNAHWWAKQKKMCIDWMNLSLKQKKETLPMKFLKHVRNFIWVSSDHPERWSQHGSVTKFMPHFLSKKQDNHVITFHN